MPIVLALDAGTGGAKCVAIDHLGRVRGSAARRWAYEVAANAAVPMVKEYAFDADEFWAILGDCARAATRDLRADEIIGVVATSQREGCVFLDPAGREIYAGPNLDSRGFMEGLHVLEKLGAARLYAITGHSAPFIFPIARYLWFRHHDKRAVARILMINDWMAWRACGAICSEPSNATESMLFDFRARRWSPEILQLFDIDPAILAPMRNPGDHIGSIGAAAASHLGVAAGTPMFAGGADTQCSALGAGAVARGDVAVTFGTTTPVQMVTDRPILDPAENLWAGCHVVPDRWVLESNAGSTGDGYEWLLDLLVGDAHDRYPRAEELAAAAEADAIFSFVGPRIFDLNKIRPDMPGAVLFPFPSLQLRPDAGQLLRSFLASVAFAVRGNLEQIHSVAGTAASTLKVGGGMARNRLLMQMVADCTGVPVECAREWNTTALGCAALVCVAAGIYNCVDAAVAAMCASETIPPDAEHAGAADAAYRRWRSLYDNLDTLSI